MHHVHSAHFSDELLESSAFMQAHSLEIDIYDFQLISLPCVSIFDRSVIEWFFKGSNGENGRNLRILSCNRLKLGPYFVAELVKQFCEETRPNPTSLILCGRIIQCRRSFEQMVDQYKNGMEIVQARNESTGEVLRIQLLQTEKIEISRSFETKQHEGGRCRPVGQSARAVFV
ncbi:hypothetical protein M3Y97_00667800 [Aphelenchoides bicaudatus]|nr:hypothetical protein M3Y97_00667800 [Aphelenchoides bicaudatus]